MTISMQRIKDLFDGVLTFEPRFGIEYNLVDEDSRPARFI